MIKNIPTDCATDELATQTQLEELITTIKEESNKTRSLLEEVLLELKKANLHLELGSDNNITNERDYI